MLRAGSCALCPGQRQIYRQAHEAGASGPITCTAPSKTFYLTLYLHFLRTFSGLVWVGEQELKRLISKSADRKQIGQRRILVRLRFNHREGESGLTWNRKRWVWAWEKHGRFDKPPTPSHPELGGEYPRDRHRGKSKAWVKPSWTLTMLPSPGTDQGQRAKGISAPRIWAKPLPKPLTSEWYRTRETHRNQ